MKRLTFLQFLKEANKSSDDLIGQINAKLTQLGIDDSKRPEILNIIKNNMPAAKKITSIFKTRFLENTIGLSSNQAQSIIKELNQMSGEVIQSLLTFLGIPTKSEDIEKIDEKSFNEKQFNAKRLAIKKLTSSNLYSDICDTINLDLNLFNFFADYIPAGMPAWGRGELILAIILKGGKKGSKGDIEAENKFIEVKGSGARIRNQSNLSDPTNFISTLKQEFLALLKKNESKFNKVEAKKIKDFIDSFSFDTSFNFIPKTQNTNKFILTCQMFAEKIKNFEREEKRILTNALKSTFRNSSALDFSWINNLKIDQNCNFKFSNATDDFIKNWFKTSLQSYIESDGFKYIALFNNKIGKLQIFNLGTESSLNSFIEKINSDYTITTPSFSSKAGIQGGAFAINLI